MVKLKPIWGSQAVELSSDSSDEEGLADLEFKLVSLGGDHLRTINRSTLNINLNSSLQSQRAALATSQRSLHSQNAVAGPSFQRSAHRPPNSVESNSSSTHSASQLPSTGESDTSRTKRRRSGIYDKAHQKARKSGVPEVSSTVIPWPARADS